MTLVHIYLRYSFVLFYKHAYNLVKYAVIDAVCCYYAVVILTFMSNASIIDVFNHISVSEVILKTRIINTKHTRTTFLNLMLLSNCNYLRGFI